MKKNFAVLSLVDENPAGNGSQGSKYDAISPLAPNFISFDSPGRAFCAVRSILNMIDPYMDFSGVTKVYMDIERLFEGRMPGFRACNTEYHDLRHTLDVTLAMARILHSYVLAGGQLSHDALRLGLVAALMHDTGYIQADEDCDGTGAKYTTTHVERGIEFVQKYAMNCRLSPELFAGIGNILLCTWVGVEIDSIPFESPTVELMGKMLGCADILGQMSDRTYLEKLLFLYREFREAGISDFNSERELLEKTLGFYSLARKRMDIDLGGVSKCLPLHFRALFGIERNLYEDAIDKNIEYLKSILGQHDHRSMLRRNGYTDRLVAMGF